MGEIAGSYILDDLPMGRHFIMIEKEGYSRFYKKISLRKENLTINVQMDEWTPFTDVGIGLIPDADKEFLKETAKELGADVLLLGSVQSVSEKKYVVKAQLFEASTSNFSIVEDEVFKGKKRAKKYFAKAVEKLIKKGLTASNNVIPFSTEEFASITRPIGEPQPVTVQEYEEGSKGPSIFKKWWFWAIVGGAGLAATGGVLLFTDVAKKDPRYNVLQISK